MLKNLRSKALPFATVLIVLTASIVYVGAGIAATSDGWKGDPPAAATALGMLPAATPTPQPTPEPTPCRSDDPQNPCPTPTPTDDPEPTPTPEPEPTPVS